MSSCNSPENGGHSDASNRNGSSLEANGVTTTPDLCPFPVCPVCLEPQTKQALKLLSCYHSFCIKCVAKSEQSNQFKCTVCSDTTHHPIHGIKGLQEDFVSSNQLQVAQMARHCKRCDTKFEVPLQCFCKECKGMLCPLCQSKDKFHAVHHLKDFVEELRTMCKHSAGAKCHIHQTPSQMYCDTCDRTICDDCRVRNHMGDGHMVRPADMAADARSDDLGQMLDLMERQHQNIELQMALVNAQEQNLEQQLAKALNTVQNTVAHFEGEVQTFQFSILDDIDHAADCRRQDLRNFKAPLEAQQSRLAHVIAFMRANMENASFAQQLSLRNQLKSRLELEQSFRCSSKLPDVKLEYCSNLDNITMHVRSACGYLRCDLPVGSQRDRNRQRVAPEVQTGFNRTDTNDWRGGPGFSSLSNGQGNSGSFSRSVRGQFPVRSPHQTDVRNRRGSYEEFAMNGKVTVEDLQASLPPHNDQRTPNSSSSWSTETCKFGVIGQRCSTTTEGQDDVASSGNRQSQSASNNEPIDVNGYGGTWSDPPGACGGTPQLQLNLEHPSHLPPYQAQQSQHNFAAYHQSLLQNDCHSTAASGHLFRQDPAAQIAQFSYSPHYYHGSTPAKNMPSLMPRQQMLYKFRFGEYGTEVSNFTEPSGVATAYDGRIVITDANTHRLQQWQYFDDDNPNDCMMKYLGEFGEAGKEDGQLLYPNRVAVNDVTNEIVITERNPTHQVQVYTIDGFFVRRFATNQLQHPRGIAVDSQGRIIIIESKVHKTWIFTEMGRLIKQFHMDEVDFPNSVCVNEREQIFVSDNSRHCVLVYDYTGHYLWRIGGEGFTNFPIGVSIGPGGYLYVMDNHNNFNITVFLQEGGEPIAGFESKVKHAQVFDTAMLKQGLVVVVSKDFRVYIYKIPDAFMARI